MSWLQSAQGADFGRVFSLRPNLYADYQAFVGLFAKEQLLPAPLLLLVRERLEQLHGLSDTKPDLGLSDLPNCAPSCLEIAELFVQDPHAIPDSPVAIVRDELGDAAVVALMEWLAICDGFTRFKLILETGNGD